MSALPNSVVIHSIEVQPVEFCGQRVLTFAQIDKLHDRPDGTTKRSFRENKSRLTAGDDFYLIDYTQKDEFRPFGIKIPPRGLIVITESGYLLLVKSFTDDLAWAVQKELVKVYFRAKAMKQPTSAAIPTDLPTALRAYAAEIESHHDDSSMIEMLNQQLEILKELLEICLNQLAFQQCDDPDKATSKAFRHQLSAPFINYIAKDHHLHETPKDDAFRRALDQLFIGTFEDLKTIQAYLEITFRW